MPRALITGVTGQDGSYLADLLLEKNYEVFGMVRRTSKPHFDNIAHLLEHPQFHILYGDLTDQGSINRAVIESTPDEVYNLAAQSFVGGSWDYPVSTADITGLGPLRLLEALRQFNPKAKFYQASSSEMYGNQGGMLDENSVFAPRSPYGSAKAFAHYTTINYRESYGIFACCGILFNHESPRRGVEFVTRKITDGVSKIMLGKEKKLKLGNIDSRRDWGDARDYVRAMWLMLQQPTPNVYVIATGQSYSIKNFLGLAFNEAGIAKGGLSRNNWEQYIEIDPSFNRPADIEVLMGDAAKARELLKWKPEITFKQMVSDMMATDMERNK